MVLYHHVRRPLFLSVHYTTPQVINFYIDINSKSYKISKDAELRMNLYFLTLMDLHSHFVHDRRIKLRASKDQDFSVKGSSFIISVKHVRTWAKREAHFVDRLPHFVSEGKTLQVFMDHLLECFFASSFIIMNGSILTKKEL